MHILQKAIIGTVSGALAGGLTSFGSTLYFRKEDKKEREIEKQEDKKFQNITKNEYLRRLKKELNSRNKLDEETSLHFINLNKDTKANWRNIMEISMIEGSKKNPKIPDSFSDTVYDLFNHYTDGAVIETATCEFKNECGPEVALSDHCTDAQRVAYYFGYILGRTGKETSSTNKNENYKKLDNVFNNYIRLREKCTKTVECESNFLTLDELRDLQKKYIGKNSKVTI